MAPDGFAAPGPRLWWPPPCPPTPQEALLPLKRLELESPQPAQEQPLAAPLPSGTLSAQHPTGHPHSGQINSFLLWGKEGLGGAGVAQPCGLKPAKR